MPENTTRSQDIGGKPNVYAPIYVDTTGQYRRLPSDGILDIAGVSSPNFTVDGRAIMFADGSSSTGESSVDLQTVYNHSTAVNGAAKILLQAGKDFSICDIYGNPFISVDSETGKVTINGEMSVVSSIVKFLGAYQEFDHLNVLSNDGLKTSLLIEPKPGITFQTDPVRIRTTAGGATDFAINTLGQTYIRDLIVDSISGVSVTSLSNHLSPLATPFKHFAAEIKYEPTLDHPTEWSFGVNTSVDEALDSIINSFSVKIKTLSDAIDLILQDEATETGFFQRIANLETSVASTNLVVTNIDTRLTTAESNIQTLTSAISALNTANIVGINFEQFSPSSVWTIHHNTGSQFIQFSVYDDSNRLLWPDDAFVLDDQTFVVVFGDLQVGRCILSCLIPPVTTITENVTPVITGPQVHLSFNNGFSDYYGHDVIVNGNLSIDSFSKFGSACMRNFGAGYLDIDLGADDQVVAGDNYTMQFWFLAEQFPNDSTILAYNGYGIGIRSGVPFIILDPYNYVEASGKFITPGVYQHLAVVKNGSLFTIFFEGKPCISLDNSLNALPRFETAFSHILFGSDGQFRFVGLVDDFTFCKQALYTEEFTPTTIEQALTRQEQMPA